MMASHQHQHQRTPSSDDVRQHIVQSLFSRYDEQGTAEETLISFVKIYEEEGDGVGNQKTRYLMLAVTKFGKVVLHKCKRNNNLSFSKGKTWQLEDTRGLEVMGPTDFALTMTIRRYHWTTERARDQQVFLNSFVKVFKTYTKTDIPEMSGFTPMPTPTSASSNGGGMAPPPPAGGRGPSPASAGISPGVRSIDLAPPPRLRDHRSGSSSSLASGASGSQYMSDGRSHSVGRPSLDEHRSGSGSGSAFGRSPLADPGIPVPAMARRPSGEANMAGAGAGGGRRPSEPYHQHQHQQGQGQTQALGLGLPSSQSYPNRLSVDRDRLPTSTSMRKISSSEGQSRSHSRGSGEIPRVAGPRPSPGETTPTRPTRSSNRGSSPGGPVIPQVQQPQQPYIDVFEEESDPRTPRPPDIVPPPLGPPTITTTLPSPAIPTGSTLGVPGEPLSAGGLGGGGAKGRPQRRASFHPPPLDTAFSREVLLTSRTGALPGAAGLTLESDGEGGQDAAIMDSVEDVLESFDWTVTNGTMDGSRKKGSADAIENRLMDELSALDSANIHAFLESDDRISQVLGHIDEALLELDDIDMQITSYKMQLNAVSDDISFIESQNRGLQVQTSNQQALLNEIKQLLQIAEVPPEDLRILVQESPQSARGVQTLELAAASLYKALQAGRDQANAEVAATIARLREYQENSQQFTKRILDYLDIAFKHQSESTLVDFRKNRRKADGLQPHQAMGEYLMMYEGLVLYIKEMDEDRYQRLCSNYMAAASQLHQSEMKELLMGYIGSLNTGGDNLEASFVSAAKADAPKPSALQKSKTIIGLRGSDPSGKKEKANENSLRAAELYQQAITEIINQMVIEEDFINAFLHLTDTESTFADHMRLDSYFRRQAARHASKAMSTGLMQLVRSTMDLVFGFVDQECKNWVDAATARDPLTIVGVIAVTERVAMEAEQEQTSMFFSQLFERQLGRQRAALDAFIAEQLRAIDGAKNSARKRKGVAFYVRHFPIFVERLEAQLDGADGLPIRDKANSIYDKLINAIFGSLTQMAKTDRGDGQAAEDKGQLNYHVIMIENMRHFVDDVAVLNKPVLAPFLGRAQGLYDENLGQYIKLMLRRSFGRLSDFFDNIERVLQNTPATEVSLHQSCSKSALKKLLKDHTAKDMRKSVEAMARRIDKQFSHDDEPGGASAADPVIAEVINTVWKEITSELKRDTGRVQELIGRCYSDSNLGIEYGPGDVEAACKKAKA